MHLNNCLFASMLKYDNYYFSIRLVKLLPHFIPKLHCMLAMITLIPENVKTTNVKQTCFTDGTCTCLCHKNTGSIIPSPPLFI